MILRYYSLTIFFILFSISLNYAQQNLNTIGLDNLILYKDSIFFKEISSFTIKGMAYYIKGKENFTPVELNIYNCSENHVNFKPGKKSNYISIYANDFNIGNHEYKYDSINSKIISIDDQQFWGISGKIPQKEIVEINYIHVNYRVKIPSEAWKGLYNPKFCSMSRIPRKKNPSKPTKNIIENFAKTFVSQDNKRIYIYMLGGDEDGKYEVTWMFKNSEYLGRVIDKIN